ncbi:MAG: pilin [Candidatus Paceibacterota bacterium]
MTSISRFALVSSLLVILSVPAATSAQFIPVDTAGTAEGGTVFTSTAPEPVGQAIIPTNDFSNSKMDNSTFSLGSGGGRGGSTACDSLTDGGFVGVVDCIIVYINYFIYLIVSLTVIYTILGAFKMLSSEEKREEGKNAIIYGIVGLFVMMSIWGFVNILEGTFQLSGDAPMTPTPLERTF